MGLYRKSIVTMLEGYFKRRVDRATAELRAELERAHSTIVDLTRELAECRDQATDPEPEPEPNPEPEPDPDPEPPAPAAYLNRDFYNTWPAAGALTDPDTYPIGCWNSAAGYQVDPDWDAGSTFPAALKHFGINLIYAYDGGHPLTTTHATQLRDNGVSIVTGTNSHRNWLKANPAHAGIAVGQIPGEEFDMNWPREANYPTAVQRLADEYRAADPSRPIIINWGKCMGGWGAGYHPEPGHTYAQDMGRYQAATDGTCCDFYGWTDPWGSKPKGAYVYGDAVDLQRKYAGANVPAWVFVEASRPWSSGNNGSGPHNVITPAQMESAFWQGIIHGAAGIIWFLQDMYAGGWSGPIGNRSAYRGQGEKMRELSRWAGDHARLLNTAPLGVYDTSTGRFDTSQLVQVSASGGVPVDVMVKRHAGVEHTFVQASGTTSRPGSGATTVTLTWPGGKTAADAFAPYQARVYTRPV